MLASLPSKVEDFASPGQRASTAPGPVARRFDRSLFVDFGLESVMQVRDILRVKGRALYAVAPHTLLSECVTTMADLDIGSLVVMDQGRLIGMLSFREVIRVLAKRQRELRSGPTPTMSAIRADEVMEPDPRVATPDMEVNVLRKMMLEHHHRYVPVVDGPLLLGVISFYDVARAVLDAQSFENRMLKAYIRDWPAEG